MSVEWGGRSCQLSGAAVVRTRQDGPVQHVGVGEEDVAVAAPRRALGVGRVAVVGAGAHGAAQQPGSTEAAAKLGRAVAARIGRAFMAARVASITDDESTLDGRTVRIVVGEKP